MSIDVLYFASLREALGVSSERLDSLPPGVTSAGQLRAWLRERGAPWSEALGEDRAVRIAVNRVMAGAATPIAENAEVAFFPPVTGG